MSTPPAASASGLTRMKSGAFCGGTTWIMSKSDVTDSLLPSGNARVNVARFATPSIALSVWPKFSVMSSRCTHSISAGTQSATPNSTASALQNCTSMSFSTLLRSQWSAEKYMAFCGAPAHLIGMGGWVNKALPPFSACTGFQV